LSTLHATIQLSTKSNKVIPLSFVGTNPVGGAATFQGSVKLAKLKKGKKSAKYAVWLHAVTAAGQPQSVQLGTVKQG